MSSSITPNWKAIATNIEKYIDDEAFYNARSVAEIMKILDIATLSADQFCTCIINLSYHHDNDTMLEILKHIHVDKINNDKEQQSILQILSRVIKIPIFQSIQNYDSSRKQASEQNKKGSKSPQHNESNKNIVKMNKIYHQYKTYPRENELKYFDEMYSVFKVIVQENDVEACQYAITHEYHLIIASKNDTLHSIFTLSGYYNEFCLTKFLIDNGADPYIRDGDLQTILHMYCENNNLIAVNYLVSNKLIDVNATDRSNQTPLEIAVQRRYVYVCRYLLSIPETIVNEKILQLIFSPGMIMDDKTDGMLLSKYKQIIH